MKNLLGEIFSKVPLRVVLVVPFLLQIFIAVGLTGWFSFRNGQEAVNKLANRLQTELSDRIDRHLDGFLAAPHQVNQMNARAIELGLIDPNNLRLFGRYFWTQMQVYPDFGYINFASPRNKVVGINREIKKGILEMDLTEPAYVGKSYTYALDARGNPTQRVKVEDYDFRNESWYVDAIKAGHPLWSQIYNWNNDPSILSISASYPLYDKDKQLIGVIGVDLLISRIGDFLHQWKIAPSATTFILERDGLLVASSSDEKVYALNQGKAKRLRAIDSQDPAVKQIVQYLLADRGNLTQIKDKLQFPLSINGQKAFVQVTPWQDEFGLDWLIVATVPESDFMAQIEANNRTTILLCLGALTIATLLGIYTSRWIARPILKLSQASKQLAETASQGFVGQIEQTVDVKSIRELNILGQSFNQMAGQLQKSFVAIEKTNEELERRVEERTAELRSANQEITKLNERLKTENMRMSAELDVTRQLQQMILPKDDELKQIEGLDIAGFMEPADEVGGDYYDVLQHDGRVKIGIGDVTGHGLESGVVMIMAQTAVRTLLAVGETNPAKFINALNQAIYGNTRRMESYKNMTIALLDYEAGIIRLSGQHEELAIARNDGSIEAIDTFELGFPLGIESDIANFVSETKIELQSGEVVVLYTDGITEAVNPQNQQYGSESMYEILRQNRHRSAHEIRQAIIDDLRQHIGVQKVFDDITLLVLKQK